MIKGKYIYLGCNLYKFVNPHKFDLSEAVSLINVMTGEFARHRDGIIIDSSYEADELFLYDSSFKFQVSSFKSLIIPLLYSVQIQGCKCIILLIVMVF